MTPPLHRCRSVACMRGTKARPAPVEKPVPLSDPRVPAGQIRDCGEPLTALGESFGSCRALVRVSVARRLAQARDAQLEPLISRFVAPLAVAPHVAGAAA